MVKGIAARVTSVIVISVSTASLPQEGIYFEKGRSVYREYRRLRALAPLVCSRDLRLKQLGDQTLTSYSNACHWPRMLGLTLLFAVA